MFGLIGPTIAILANIAYLVYLLGEVYSKYGFIKGVPISLVFVILKIFFNCFVIFSIYGNFIFSGIIPQNSLADDITILIFFLWGLLLIVDSYIIKYEIDLINKMILNGLNSKSPITDKQSAIDEYRGIYNPSAHYNIIRFGITFLICLCFAILLFANDVTMLEIFLIVYVYINYLIGKHVSNKKFKTNGIISEPVKL